MVNKISKLLIFAILATECINIDSYEKIETIDNASWPSNKIYRFEYISQDSLKSKDVFISLRHTGLYKYNNIFLFITTIAPNGRSIKDTAEFTLADVHGKWAGNGIGDVYDIKLAFKRNVKFFQSGRYVFYIQHGMRDLKLHEVTDIGININSSKE